MWSAAISLAATSRCSTVCICCDVRAYRCVCECTSEPEACHPYSDHTLPTRPHGSRGQRRASSHLVWQARLDPRAAGLDWPQIPRSPRQPPQPDICNTHHPHIIDVQLKQRPWQQTIHKLHNTFTPGLRRRREPFCCA